MTNLNHPLLLAQIARTFRQLGAKQYELVRAPKDANGQPTGPPAVVGTVFGLSYIDPNYRDRIHIDLPGIMAGGANVPTLTCIKLCGEGPLQGDVIRCGDRETAALSVIASGPIFTITTEAVIA